VRVTELGKSTAILEWKAPADIGGSKITGYHVHICHEGKEDWKELEKTNAYKLTAEVKDLKWEKRYLLAVTAENDVDESEMAIIPEAIKIDKPQDYPSPPVGPIKFSNVDKTSATASWQRSKSTGGSPITHYLVEIREKSKRTWTHVTEVRSDLDALTCELKDLVEGQEYILQVKAVNSVGASKPLESDTPLKPKSQYSPPSAPRDLQTVEVTHNSATLEWKAPVQNGGAEVTYYHIERREKTYGSWKPEGRVKAPEMVREIPGLKEGVEYYFKVLAENEAGKGPFTDMIGPIKPEKKKCK